MYESGRWRLLVLFVGMKTTEEKTGWRAAVLEERLLSRQEAVDSCCIQEALNNLLYTVGAQHIRTRQVLRYVCYMQKVLSIRLLYIWRARGSG